MESLKPENNGSFVFYESFYSSASVFGKEFLNRAIIQIVQYGLYNIEPDNTGDQIMAAMWMNWKPLLDATRQKKKGGAPKGNKNAAGHKGTGGRPKKDSNEKLQPKLQHSDVDADADVDIDVDADADASANADGGLTPFSPLKGERATALDAGDVGDDYWVYDPEVAEREMREWLEKNGTV